jgi:hypothetical protein
LKAHFDIEIPAKKTSFDFPFYRKCIHVLCNVIGQPPPPKKKWNWFIATYGTAKKYISLSIYLSVSLCVLHSPWYVGSNAHFAQPQSKCRYCLFRDLKITRGASPGTFDVHLFRFYLYYLYYIVIQNNNVRNCCQLQLSTLLRYVFLLF